MNTTDFFKNKDRADRIELLSANATKKETFNYFKPLTEDQLEPFHEVYFSAKHKIEAATEVLEEAKKQFKSVTEEPKEEMAEAYGTIRAKGMQVSEDVYLIPNYEAGIMDYVNEDGDTVFSRRLLPTERQIIMKAVN